MSFLSALAPTIATALGGPLAGAAVEFLADKLGATDKTKDNIVNTIQGLDPLAAKKLDIEYAEFLASNGIQLQLAQIAVNTEEAKSSSTFVAGWRPFVGWVGGSAFAYVSIVEPIARFIAAVGFGYHGVFPVIDTTVTMQVLVGILGLGAFRSFDKKNGTAS
jgi:hypothetical protein